jgi:hypothetical protein
MINELCDVKFEADAVDRIVEESKGKVRKLISLIHKVEAVARAHQLKSVGAKDFK